MIGKFGLYLLSTGRISEADLERAAAYRSEHPFLRIGEVLVSQRALSLSTLIDGLEEYRGQCKLGEILLMDGVITGAQLEEALMVQASTGLLLGKILVDLRCCSFDAVMKALATQRRLQTAA